MSKIMPTFISDSAYEALLRDLSAAFMIAATSAGRDLHDELAEALANADILPEMCRPDFAVAEVALAA
ncbi:hypothetical protein IT40_25265 [Paracoccus versutus]|nr:hypothetical protein IT40_25265 [Paracoccus versutus]